MLGNTDGIKRGRRDVVTKKSILLIEDQKSIAKMVTRLVGDAGYENKHARNGQEALELLQEGYRPDLILLDIIMPVMGGYEFLDEFNKDSAMKGIPVVMMTGRDEATDVVKAVKRGAVDYITKPFEPDYLLARIGNILQQ
jgi:two-component system sensor histidine kinase ChiS